MVKCRWFKSPWMYGGVGDQFPKNKTGEISLRKYQIFLYQTGKYSFSEYFV